MVDRDVFQPKKPKKRRWVPDPPVMNGVITLISRVILPVTHLSCHLQRSYGPYL